MVVVRPLVLVALLPVVAVATGAWVYRDATHRGRGELAPYVGVGIGLAFLAGSVPGLVALALTSDPAVQGFPTALRLTPGVLGLAVYLRFR